MDFGPADDSGQGASNFITHINTYYHMISINISTIYLVYFNRRGDFVNGLPEPDKVIDIDLPKVAKSMGLHLSLIHPTIILFIIKIILKEGFSLT